MPAADGTLIPEDVADELGLPVDARMTTCTDAARAWAQRRRCLTPPATLWSQADAHQGGVLYACLLYQARVTPGGIAGYDEAAATDTSAEALWRARELVGQDLVIA